MSKEPANILQDLWRQGVDAVRGYSAVQSALSQEAHQKPDLIVAVGKAAGDMTLGALAHFQKDIKTIVVTKYGHVSDELAAQPMCETCEAAHPIPDQNSLEGGARVLEAVSAMKPDEHLLLLVSGGASALVEVLKPGVDLDGLAALNTKFMAEGLSIGQINAERRKISRVKGGGLLRAFAGKSADVIAVSDVEGDSIDVIASGIGACDKDDGRVKITIAASNAVARKTIADAAQKAGLAVRANEECLYGSAEEAAASVLEKIDAGPAGLYIFGGEPTVELPENPGRGGRNQHLALLLAQHIKSRGNIDMLIAGTDGTDGPTAEAGAVINGATVSDAREAETYLAAADAGTYLDARGALLTTGPTGTNVMDIVLVLKS